MKATGDHEAMRDELYQEMKDALEAELNVTFDGGVDAIGWLELRSDKSDDVIDLVVPVIKSVMWMVTGEECKVKMTARGAKVYNNLAVASPEMLANHADGTNTFSLVMHMYPTPDDESKMKMTVGEIRRRLHCVHLNEGFNSDMCNELFTELEGTLKDELGEENVRAEKTPKSKPMFSQGIRYFGKIYVTRNTDPTGPKTYKTISDSVQSVLTMLDGAAPKYNDHFDDPSYVSSFATIDIERTSGAVAFDGYTVYVIQHLDKGEVNEASAHQGYQSLLDQAMNDMLSVNKTLEQAHEQAPAGVPKAIIMGLHNDVFQTVTTFREYVGKLKGLKEAREASLRDINALYKIASEFAEELAAQIPDAYVHDFSELDAETENVLSVEFRVNFARKDAPRSTELWEMIRNILWMVSGVEPSKPVHSPNDVYHYLGTDDFAVSSHGQVNQQIKILALDEDSEALNLRKG